MTLSAMIVDDEQLARDELAYLLKNTDDVNVVAQGKNGLEAVNLIKEHNPDLVFLDVQMPGLDGFGVIKKLLDKKIPLPKIVFATAFDQYAVKAFEVNAVDYLLKPFDKKRVAQAIQKARAKQESNALPAEKIETLVHFVGVLTRPDTYTYLGCIFEGTKYVHGRKSPIGHDAPSAKAFAWCWDKLMVKRAMPESLEVFHEGPCGKCGRRLTDPTSISVGLGPTCRGE